MTTRNRLAALVGTVAIAATLAAPAQAHDWRRGGGGYGYRYNNGGAAIAAGIGALALGAALMSPRSVYVPPPVTYYAPPPPPVTYYAPGYYAPPPVVYRPAPYGYVRPYGW